MNKRKGIITTISILSIILVVVFSTVAVRSSTVKKSIDLGNKYVIEGNYEKAIVAFEKAIKIDKKNTYVKETLDVLYIYEDIIELVEQGELEKAQEKLEEIKDMPKFDIIKDMTENIEQVIEDEIIKNGMGNSVENHLNGGLVAYSGKYAYYSNPNDEGKLYKINIESGKTEKIADENANYISIYNDYVYYINCSGNTKIYKDIKREIKRVSIKGGEIETVLGLDENIYGSMQIVDDTLYYDANYFYDENFGSYSGTYDIIAMNLETLEKKTINNLNIYQWVIAKNINDEVNLYAAHRYSVGIIRDITNKKSSLEYEVLQDGLWNASIVAVNDTNMYYNTIHIMDAFSEATYDSGIGVTNHLTNQSSVFYETMNFLNSGFILGDNTLFNIDYNVKKYVNEIDLKTKRISNSIYIDINSLESGLYGFYGYYYSTLFEVKGYLTYFNENSELIINKDIIVKNVKSNSNEESADEESASEQMELEETIDYVKSEVAKYMKSEVVYAGYYEVDNSYQFTQLSMYSPNEYYYYPESGEIIYLNQGIEIVINDNYRNVTSEMYTDSDEAVEMIVSNIPSTMDKPSNDIKTLAKRKFGDLVDYAVSPTSEYEVNGIELYYAKVNTGGKSEYDPIDVYLGSNGKIYYADLYSENNELVEVEFLQ